MILIEASNINHGEYFRKKNGTYVYLRISESSLRFINIDPAEIYGVCFNGNIACVNRSTLVERCRFDDFKKNVEANREWHMEICRRRVD
jgi:hypothetical protein